MLGLFFGTFAIGFIALWGAERFAMWIVLIGLYLWGFGKTLSVFIRDIEVQEYVPGLSQILLALVWPLLWAIVIFSLSKKGKGKK